MASQKLTIVIPAYNEEEVLPSTLSTLLNIENEVASTIEQGLRADILVVDDGSSDRTWEIVEKQHNENSRVSGLRFSRNFGHQNALIAGLNEAVKTADMIVTIDADLQDNPEKIPEMVQKYEDGADIVLGVRNNRDSDSWFKRTTAEGFYKTLKMLGVDMVPNHADFRLMSNRAVKAFLNYPERNLFIRGIIPKLGFPTEKVYYKRTPRLAGESKYPLKKMLAFAWDGITSLTIAPVRLISIIGVGACLLSVGMVVYAFIMKMMGMADHGWSSLMVSMWFISGVQMIGLGVIGEYIGKIMTEVKDRPRYTIQTILK